MFPLAGDPNTIVTFLGWRKIQIFRWCPFLWRVFRASSCPLLLGYHSLNIVYVHVPVHCAISVQSLLIHTIYQCQLQTWGGHVCHLSESIPLAYSGGRDLAVINPFWGEYISCIPSVIEVVLLSINGCFSLNCVMLSCPTIALNFKGFSKYK